METPDPPNDTPGALKQVVLTPHGILWSLRALGIQVEAKEKKVQKKSKFSGKSTTLTIGCPAGT